MTAPRPLAGGGTGARPYAHLLPLVEAEVSWGNSDVEGFCQHPDGWWSASLRRPLHLDRLREVFALPAHVELGSRPDGSTWVVDGENRVKIVAAGDARGPRRPGRSADRRAGFPP